MYRVGILAFAALSTLVLAPGLTGVQAAEPYQISGPHTHENLSIYFLHGASAPGPVPLTLAEALKNKTVEVIETGSVRELAIENSGDREVFIQMGDIVKGGRQDRVLTRSLLIPPKSGRVKIGSYCVERGRWSRRGLENASRFDSALRMLPSRAAKLALAAPPPKLAPAPAPSAEQRQSVDNGSASETLARGRRRLRQRYAGRSGPSRQAEIWNKVFETQNKLSGVLGERVASARSPSSLQLALENKKLNKRIDEYVGALTTKAEGRDDVIGYVFAVNGQINSADVYPSNGLFRKMWPKLLKAAATEAIGEAKQKAGKAPSVETVNLFLKDAEQGKVEFQQNLVGVEVETRGTKRVIYNETRRARRRSGASAKRRWGDFLHRNYLAN